MATTEAPVRPELRAASDAVIEDAGGYAEPMVLRGLLYQLTGDPEVKAMGLKKVEGGPRGNGCARDQDDHARRRTGQGGLIGAPNLSH